jgi:hypothetical protein
MDEALLRKSMKRNDHHVSVVQDMLFKMKQQVIICGEAQKIIDEPNAGGASVVSETLSAEYMCRRFGAMNIVSEMKIQYFFINWKKIDYIATIDDQRVGVSVTRAMGFPTADDFQIEDALRLCYKKLYGLIVARSGISRMFSYDRSILHCFCQSKRIATLMKQSFDELIENDKKSPEDVRLTGNITIILTVCENMSGIFTEDLTCFR